MLQTTEPTHDCSEPGRCVIMGAHPFLIVQQLKMSFVDVSRVNTDVVNVLVEQTGSASADCNFRLPLLEPKRRYVCGVSGLSVPFHATRMMGMSNPVLMYIRRRNVGNDIRQANNVSMVGPALDAATQAKFADNDRHILNHTRLPLQGINDFLMILESFASLFTRSIREVGLDPALYGQNYLGPADPFAPGINVGDQVDLLKFGISPSGLLIIQGEPLFWAHFYIELTPFAQEIFGIKHQFVSASIDQATGVLAYFEDELYDPNTFIIQPATVNVTIPIFGTACLYNTLEQRLSVHLSTSLPINKTVVIQNNKETSSFDLASFILDHNITTDINIKGFALQSETKIYTNQNIGQRVLQNRSDTITEWSPLLQEGEGIQVMKLRLQLKQRYYDILKKEWVLQKVNFPVGTADKWTAMLQFVSL